MGSKFLQIPAQNVSLLTKLLESRLPKSVMIYNIVRLFLDKRYSENVSTRFYALGDYDMKNKNAFVISVQDRKFYRDTAIHISAPESPTPEMFNELELLLNWSAPVIFAAVDRSSLATEVSNMCRRNGRLLEADPCYAYYMPIEDAIEIQIEEEYPTVSEEGKTIKVKELSPEDAEIVTSQWMFSSEGTLETMQDSISTVTSAGVYVNSELVSWAVTSSAGCIVALYTIENYRRKGYAEMVLKGCCKFGAEKGLVPNGQAQFNNFASKTLLEKLNFRFSNEIEWILYRPKGNNHNENTALN